MQNFPFSIFDFQLFFVYLHRIFQINMLCEDLYSTLSPIIAEYEQVCFVADEKLASQLGAIPSCYGGNTLSLPVPESSKTLDTVTRIWDFLFEKGITRRGLLVAVGGGVLTDLAGFAAATYKRGIHYLNIPTTLLAMVDASTGGKTGFNYHGLKNSIGTFYPPAETLIWPGWLKTLPSDQFLSGFAEMLKTGLLNTKLWPQLLQYDLNTIPLDILTPLIGQSVAVKERIVAADPMEQGLRKALNLGHTFGHALEEIQMANSQSSNHPFLHGYAVLYGMIAALYLSVTKLRCSKAPLQQLTQIMLHYYGRPQCKCSDLDALVALMQQDKKNERAAQINCTLIRSVGSPVINQIITPGEAREALEYLFSL